MLGYKTILQIQIAAHLM